MLSADVSVVIPHYNNITLLIRAINSVIAQTIKCHEIIVIDDGSSDNLDTLSKIFIDYIETKQLNITRLNKNQGAANAKNIGVLQATSKYIAFLDSDDIWHPRKLELQYKLMQEQKALLSFHRYRQDISLPVDEKAFFANVYHDITFTKLNKRKFIVTNPIATPTVMARREVFKPFNPHLKRMEDYECWVRNSRHTDFLFIDADLAAGYKPPIGHAGLSANIPAMHADLLTALKMLYKNQDIDVNFFISAYLLECLKYPIRLRRAKR